MFRSLLSFFVPRHCDICQGMLLDTENTICHLCSTTITSQFNEDDTNSPLARLFWGLIPIERAGILFDYQSNLPVSELLVKIKYQGNGDLCMRLGKSLAIFYQSRLFFEGIDLIIPVPLSRARQKKRGYNQSEMISRGLAEVTHITMGAKYVQRIIDNPTQTHLTQAERQKNVESIFQAICPEKLDGKHILLVDDIITTGATITSLANAILAIAPHCTFSVLALGRGRT